VNGEESRERILEAAAEVASDRGYEVKGASRDQLFIASFAQTARALTDASVFLGLGLMLGLERRPEEPTARNLFLQVREQAFNRVIALYAHLFDGELETPLFP
jgi:hypothetical protein